MALLYGRAWRLTAKNGGFRPGQYRVERIAGTQFKIDEVRGAGPADDQGRVRLALGATRHVWRRHGLLLEFSLTARVARFSLSALVLAVAEGLAILEIGGGIMAWVTFNLMKNAEKYEEAACQDFDEKSGELRDSMLHADSMLVSPAKSPMAGKAKGE